MLHQQAKQYGTMPSEVMGIETPLVAYNFDQAVMAICVRIENRLQETIQSGPNKGKPRYRTLQAAIQSLWPSERKQADPITIEQLQLMFGPSMKVGL